MNERHYPGQFFALTGDIKLADVEYACRVTFREWDKLTIIPIDTVRFLCYCIEWLV